MRSFGQGWGGRKRRGEGHCEYRQDEGLQQFTMISHDSEPGKPKKTCSYRLLSPPATRTSLCDLGVGKSQERECGKAWIGYSIKMYKYVLKC